MVATLCKHQGGLVEGECAVALDAIACKIREMVMDVAAGKVRADAREGDVDGSALSYRSTLRSAGYDAPQPSLLLWLLRVMRLQSAGDGQRLVEERGPSGSANGGHGNGLLFSPALGDDEVKELEMNPVLAHAAGVKAAEDLRKQRQARASVTPGGTGGLRRLMPNPDSGNSAAAVPTELLVDRYLEGSGVQERTGKSPLIAATSAVAVQLKSSLQTQRVMHTARLGELRRARSRNPSTAHNPSAALVTGAATSDSESRSPGASARWAKVANVWRASRALAPGGAHKPVVRVAATERCATCGATTEGGTCNVALGKTPPAVPEEAPNHVEMV